MKYLTTISAACALIFLGGCAGGKTEAKYPTGADRAATDGSNDIYSEPERVFGQGGLRLFSEERVKDKSGGGIGVNSYLWRAALDTISFMPLASADPFGGVILTDWYSPPETPGERYKLNVIINDEALRASALQVRLFKQAKAGSGWKDTAPDAENARRIEDAILTRARQIKIDK